MFGIKRKQTDPSRIVDLDDLSVRKYGDSVRRIFFPVWLESPAWGFRLIADQPWAWVCDFRSRTIALSITHFEEKDLLRAALITQIALARCGVDGSDVWAEELLRVRNIAENIGRERLANYLNAIYDMAEMNVIDMRVSEDSSRVETYLPSEDRRQASSESSSDTAQFAPVFADSLSLDVKTRQHGQACAAIKRLGIKTDQS